MKKIGLLLMVIALIGTMSCNGGKSVDTDTLCAEKVAAAVQAACDSIRAAQPVRETKIMREFAFEHPLTTDKPQHTERPRD